MGSYLRCCVCFSCKKCCLWGFFTTLQLSSDRCFYCSFRRDDPVDHFHESIKIKEKDSRIQQILEIISRMYVKLTLLCFHLREIEIISLKVFLMINKIEYISFKQPSSLVKHGVYHSHTGMLEYTIAQLV